MIDLAKGDRTRARILDEAVDLASVQGLGGLTIAPLAERLGLSKSGLFAHFDSKEALQVETLDRAADLFRTEVTEPLRAIADRRKRLRRFFERWIAWLDDSRLSGGCPILAAAIEFDDVPGPVHDAAARHLAELQRLTVKFARAAQPDGDAEALAAAVIGLAMSHLVRTRLLSDRNARVVTMRAFDALLVT
jgi:AcrR family transcriptional regulator